MSAYRERAEFKHLNDCKQCGCPGHVLEIAYNSTTDQTIVSVDGEEYAIFDDGLWNAMIELASKPT